MAGRTTDSIALTEARRTCLRMVLLVVVLGGGCAHANDRVHEFALFGDSPYRPESVPRVEALIDDVNRRSALEWVIHVGDTKGGEQPCTDEFLRGRFDLYQRFTLPFVFTPGDNDWFDCVRERADRGDEYERLDYLRSLYFPEPGRTTGGRSMEVRKSLSCEPGEIYARSAFLCMASDRAAAYGQIR